MAIAHLIVICDKLTHAIVDVTIWPSREYDTPTCSHHHTYEAAVATGLDGKAAVHSLIKLMSDPDDSLAYLLPYYQQSKRAKYFDIEAEAATVVQSPPVVNYYQHSGVVPDSRVATVVRDKTMGNHALYVGNDRQWSSKMIDAGVLECVLGPAPFMLRNASVTFTPDTQLSQHAVNTSRNMEHG